MSYSPLNVWNHQVHLLIFRGKTLASKSMTLWWDILRGFADWIYFQLIRLRWWAVYGHLEIYYTYNISDQHLFSLICHICRLIYGFVFSYNSGNIYSQDVQLIDRFVVEEYLLDVLLYLNGWYVIFWKTGVLFVYYVPVIFSVHTCFWCRSGLGVNLHLSAS